MLLKRKYLFGTTILAGVMMASAPALAQDAGQNQQDPQARETTVEEIVVTGSRIRRDPTNAPTPLIQVEREALLTTGQSTVIDYLATIPALSNSLVPSDTTGSGLNDGGLDFANLRSLGTGRTLTLVDGRRHVGSSAGTLSVDVSTIPRLLIENIEIITGGASSIYGADAVAGVLNFILRDDFEGVEFDANYGMINQNGEASRRASLLVGANLLDDRLNVYAFGEYEKADMVTSFDVDWINDDPRFIGIDADPTSAPSDGFLDNMLFYGLNRMDRPRWGQVTVANSQAASPLNDPDIPNFTCVTSTGAFTYSSSCYAVNPGKTWWFDPGQGTARLADFGQRIGNTGANRPYNYGGDGVSAADFSTASRFPEIESERFQAGFTFSILPNVSLSGEYKLVTEDVFDISQPTFFNIYLDDTSYGPTSTPVIYGVQSYDLRWSDNAFLPQNVKDAIATNRVARYSAPTATQGGQFLGDFLVQQAQYISFGPDRTQDNSREVERYVIGLDGDFDNVLFFRNVNWDIGYTRGELNNVNAERGIDSQRFALASDAVVDSAGILGSPGAIVCRSTLLDAQSINSADRVRGGALQDSQYGQDSIDQCAPLNIFGAGNQSDAALAYIDATIRVREQNISEQALVNVAGQLWDFWGAGPIGVALGYEQRREYTEGVGRSADTAGRLLFMNTGPDFLGAEYESDEFYGEIAIPLFRDGFLGDYAEFSASYREFDYTTAGKGDVYGLNLVYRPISDIAFRTSLNTSVRVPNLAENFRPATQTFYNGVVDPCATASITNPSLNPEIRANRVRNCEALAIADGFAPGFFDWNGTTATTDDDYLPNYTSGVAGVNAGNPFLEPEESESFTFSVILKPRMFPNLSVVLDYYDIRVDNVISAVSARVASENCVNGNTLDAAACATIFRNNPSTWDGISNDAVARSSGFRIGAPNGDPIGGFIQGSINYAGLETEGLDFSVNYAIDTFDLIGQDWGRFSYSLNGLWLISQESYTNTSDPTDASGSAGNLFFPRVRFNSSLTYAPNDIWSINWTADWQTSQDISSPFGLISNIDSIPPEAIRSGAFTRHDFTFRWNVRDDLSMRAGVVNAFDNEQNPYLGNTLYNNFDAWGRRFFIGFNYRPW
ncbi:TonB-dependent receptor domain-containing protein [Brevundimonas halotolerans]|uniref:Outer membrane receptor protein involved in Fe transport n=1 Tax=Brevundimonas halotolerans TaxID=69670 RepID=A0A7W9E7X4_9CAUL|nr:TonB-dependent receptor [Brevundimonas halotolerans]MBB5660145.1 outer membrane receptor protein involved in Fe transport [Brevundimonas halotolerans]